jgi:hypothetical protein
MSKKKKGEKYELVRLPYRFKFEKQFKNSCNEWLKMIETMCNEIFEHRLSLLPCVNLKIKSEIPQNVNMSSI